MSVTWASVAREIELSGLGVAMLDPHGETCPGIEAFLIRLAEKVRTELADQDEYERIVKAERE